MRKVAFAVVMFAAQAAEATPPPTALYGMIGADQVALYAGGTALGNCLVLEQMKPGQSWFQFTGPIGCIQGDEQFQGDIDSHGGPNGWITYQLPYVNFAISVQYGTNQSPAAQINSTLNGMFKFVGTGVGPK